LAGSTRFFLPNTRSWIKLKSEWRKQEIEGWLAEVGLQMTSYQEFGNSSGLQKVLLLTAGVKHS
jgi:hypothetical protein